MDTFKKTWTPTLFKQKDFKMPASIQLKLTVTEFWKMTISQLIAQRKGGLKIKIFTTWNAFFF